MNWNKLVSLTAILSLPLLTSGCASFFSTPEPKVVVQTEYVEKKIPTQPSPKPMTLNDVTWYVVTEDNFDEFLEKYKKENGDAWVFYAVSVRSYEAMALNLAEIKRYILSQQAIIGYYEKAVAPKPTNEQTEEAK